MADETPDENAALEAAVNEVIEETGAEVVPDEPKEDTPVESTPESDDDAGTVGEPATPAEETPEEEPLGLSAEQLQAINEDPKLLAVYKSMQRGLTKKTTEIAETRKSLEEKAKIADWIKSDPDKAIASLAKARGINVDSKTVEEHKVESAVDELTEKWARTLNPNDLDAGRRAAEQFRPMLEEHMKTFMEGFLTPIQQQQQDLQRASQERALAATVAEFEANITGRNEPIDDAIKTEMADKMNVMPPGEKTDIDTYLEAIYNSVMGDRMRKSAAQKQLQRLQKAKTTSEPVVGSRPAPKSDKPVISMDMSDDDAIKAAVALAEMEAS
jgi:hypothetical protein